MTIPGPSALPLIQPDRPSRTVAWRGSRSVNQRQFLRDVLALAGRLPRATHALNLCEDRYHFMTAFAAVCLRGQTNLLPPSRTPGVMGEIAAAYPGCYALGETESADLRVPWIVVNDDPGDAPDIDSRAQFSLPGNHVAAVAFTSGSTGEPHAHAKTWHALVQVARLAAQRFLVPGIGANVVATVPSQHMYGLETTVMMALAGGCAAHAGPVFFPADVRGALRQLPVPRVLITTPVHLRACLAANLAFPPLHLVISATAPLEPELAAAAEAALGAPVHEIYGCTEAGSIASRRTVNAAAWQFYSGLRLIQQDGANFVHGQYLVHPVALPDVLEAQGHDRFRLCGRVADLLKVAGKRASLSELTTRLMGIPGVSDAVVFVPEPIQGSEARPAALVVAPDLSEPQILQALETMIDPVFLPRPLIRLPALPRNAVGKLPRAALLAELERCRA